MRFDKAEPVLKVSGLRKVFGTQVACARALVSLPRRWRALILLIWASGLSLPRARFCSAPD